MFHKILNVVLLSVIAVGATAGMSSDKSGIRIVSEDHSQAISVADVKAVKDTGMLFGCTCKED